MDYVADSLPDCQSQMISFWGLIRVEIETLKCDHNAFKTQDLPLARIKKIMKLDDDIKCMMISAEAPILFAKAAELFIRELTLRAWTHTERNRRRTLQRNDIAMAVSDGDTDQFDFLIDIVPREEARGHRRPPQTQTSSTPTVNNMNVKTEHSGQSGTFLTNANGTHTISLGQNSGQVVVSGLSNDTVASSAQAQTVAVALASVASAGIGANASSVGSTIPCQAVLQQNQPTAVQFATISSTGGIVTAQSSASTVSTTVTGSASNVSTVASNAAPLQYVLQVPVGATGATAGQPFQIQVLPQQFQTANTDAVTSGQASTILTDANGNTIPVLQVVSQPGGLALPILQEANGNRTQILQLQMPESNAGRPTLFLQQAGALLGTPHMGTVITGVDGQSQQQITYSLQAQPILSADSSFTQTHVLLSLDENAQCITSQSDSGCVETNNSSANTTTTTTTNNSICVSTAHLLGTSELNLSRTINLSDQVPDATEQALSHEEYASIVTNVDCKSNVIITADSLMSLTDNRNVQLTLDQVSTSNSTNNHTSNNNENLVSSNDLKDTCSNNIISNENALIC